MQGSRVPSAQQIEASAIFLLLHVGDWKHVARVVSTGPTFIKTFGQIDPLFQTPKDKTYTQRSHFTSIFFVP